MESIPPAEAEARPLVMLAKEETTVIVQQTPESPPSPRNVPALTVEGAPSAEHPSPAADVDPAAAAAIAAQAKKDKKEKKPKEKKESKENRQKAAQKEAAPEVPFHQSLGERLFEESQQPSITLTDPRLAMPMPRHNSSHHAHHDKNHSTERLAPPRTDSHHRSSSPGSDGYVSDSVSTGSMSDIETKDPSTNAGLRDNLYTLEDFKRLEAINALIEKYSSVSHMSVRDPSYSFWVNKSRTAAVHFKLLNKVAVLAGDPLCAPAAMPATLEQFERYCRKAGWKTSIIGASEVMLEIAKLKKWPAMRFGTERVLNPSTNEVVLGKGGKRTVAQCRQLLDVAKGGLTLHVYSPRHGRDLGLESRLTKVYDDWRGERNTTRECQAFITVFEMFSMPNLMTFIYSMTKDGAINGFAALRKMGGDGHYHIDPFIQSADAPRGTSDLLIYASLALLHHTGATYLGLGHEPVHEPDEILNMNAFITSTTRRVYRHIFGKLPVGSKETFNSRWKPDTEQEAPLYLIFVGRKTPSPKHLLAMTHFANISLRHVARADWKFLKDEVAASRLLAAGPSAIPYAGAAGPIEAPRDHRPTLEKSASAPANI